LATLFSTKTEKLAKEPSCQRKSKGSRLIRKVQQRCVAKDPSMMDDETFDYSEMVTEEASMLSNYSIIREEIR